MTAVCERRRPQDDRAPYLAVLGKHWVMNLATVRDATPYCTPVFYSVLRRGQWLAFYSKPTALHISNLKANPLAGASIFRETRKPGLIQGLQLTGAVSIVPDSEQWEVKKAYLAAHPLATAVLALRRDACLYVFEVYEATLTDSVNLGFGHKIVWNFRDSGCSLPANPETFSDKPPIEES